MHSCPKTKNTTTESSTAKMPTDTALETSLRNAVRALYDDPDASVKKIRTKAESTLGLESDFFKSEEWKERSKEIIQDQFNKREEEKTASKKRASPEAEVEGGRARKKSRVEAVQQDDEDEDEESTALSEPPESEEEEEEEVPKKKKIQAKARKAAKPAKGGKKAAPKKEKPKPKAKSKPKKKAASESEVSDAPSDVADDSEEEVDTKPEPQPTSKVEDSDDDTSSELSSVIDEPAPIKKKGPKAKNGDTKSRKSSTSTTTKPTESDPNTEEIKRLQSWLVKCGIRKVWGKELKPFETPKAKIAHLKSLLSDVGMTGRYSNEKAAQIKEARELAADIEAVKEGNERWGKEGEEGEGDEEDGREGDDGGRPKRRLVRGAANYDFLSSDGEETD